MPKERLHEIHNFVKGGLHDFSISRLKSKMPWGIAVPGDDDHVMYVWFDALVNYISTLGWPEKGNFEKFWPGTQVAGIDNLRQQTAMWQAMLISAGLPTSKQVFIHGFFTANGQKMSKSLGNVIHPKTLVDDFGADAVRYYFLREMPYGTDGDYSAARMEERFAELANGLGNLVGRCAAMANKYFEGVVGDASIDVKAVEEECELAIAQFDFKRYIDSVWTVVDKANHQIDVEAPFKTVKVDAPAAKKTLAEVAAMIRFIATKLEPVIPTAAAEISRRYTGEKLEHGDPLFPRRDIPKT